MLYKISLMLHKVLNETNLHLKTETIHILDQAAFTRRQLTFDIYRNNSLRIGMNTNSNKFYHVNKLIGWDKLNFTFVHFKRLMKVQFLKYGPT